MDQRQVISKRQPNWSFLEEFEDAGEIEDKLLFAEHHQSHAASAFFPSPFEEAIILTMDGVGEWATASVAIGRGNELTTVREIQFPHSLGLLYSAKTYYTGFRVYSGEYKVMGLAPYGEPKYVDLIKNNLIDIKEDGSFWLDQSYFNYATGLTMTSSKFHDLFGAPPRTSEDQITQREMDLAASVQAVTEEVMLKMTESLGKRIRHQKSLSCGRCRSQLRCKRESHSRWQVLKMSGSSQLLVTLVVP